MELIKRENRFWIYVEMKYRDLWVNIEHGLFMRKFLWNFFFASVVPPRNIRILIFHHIYLKWILNFYLISFSHLTAVWTDIVKITFPLWTRIIALCGCLWWIEFKFESMWTEIIFWSEIMSKIIKNLWWHFTFSRYILNQIRPQNWVETFTNRYFHAENNWTITCWIWYELNNKSTHVPAVNWKSLYWNKSSIWILINSFFVTHFSDGQNSLKFSFNLSSIFSHQLSVIRWHLSSHFSVHWMSRDR